MRGKCYYCGNEFSKTGILRHIKSCEKAKKHMSINFSTDSVKKFILSISDKYDKCYFLYIVIDSNATLKDLDRFLRDIWLECCNHLSGFKIEGQRYESEVDDTCFFGNSENNMDVEIKDVVNVGYKVEYEYDFGSTTYLEIKVVDELVCSDIGKKIEIIARNNEPDIICSECGSLAKYYDHNESRYLCCNCCENYDEEDDMIQELGYMNSPRDGICGYYGKKENETAYLPEDKGEEIVNDKKEKMINHNEDILNEALNRKLKGAFKNLKNDLINNVIKKEAKKWTVMDKNFSLEYHLNRFTKNQLLTIAENLYINKVSSLKKEELKNKILELYEDSISMLIENMDIKRFQYLINLLNKDGYDDANSINSQTLSYFRDKAFLFTGTIDDKSAIIMPQEMKKIVSNKNNENFKEELKRNKELIKLFWGMCYYYGVVTLDTFKELVKKYVSYDISKVNFEIMLKDAAIYYGEFDFNGYLGNDIIVNNVVHILNEQDKRKDLDFYPFEKKELLEAARIDYKEESKGYKKLYNFLKNNFNMNSEEAEDLIFGLEYNIKNDEKFNDVVGKFLTNFEVENIEEMNIITNEVLKFADNTRQWVVKGNTPKELKATTITIIKDTKVGRNDSCPCGSGKKYKKCCGKNK